MPHHTIRFGTDGWRAVIGQDFTLENVSRVATATARWLNEAHGPGASVVVGYDPRALGPESARLTARIMAGHGVQVYFADEVTPTPAISWATKEYGCSAGIVITASHNPPEYNGFKIKGHFGGSALPEMIAEVERHLVGVGLQEPSPPSFDALVTQGLIAVRPVRDQYLQMIRDRFDIAAIRDAGIRIVHDPMYGAGRGTYRALLGEDHVSELHGEDDPAFGGTAPEPIERNLQELPERVKQLGFSAGIANDGDADRIGMCDEQGRFVDSHRLLSLLVQYLHEDYGMSGDIVKTFSTTDMIDAMGKAYGLRVRTTPIGFKYICGLFLDGEILVGGEESGGMAVSDHVPERDGIYIGMLILEMMAHRRKALSELVDDLYNQFGHFAYHRVDVHTTVSAKEHALELLLDAGGLKEIAGRPVQSVDQMDGFKHRLEGGWLLIRPSGTEPVLRIYSEAETAAQAHVNVEDAIRQLGV